MLPSPSQLTSAAPLPHSQPSDLGQARGLCKMWFVVKSSTALGGKQGRILQRASSFQGTIDKGGAPRRQVVWVPTWEGLPWTAALKTAFPPVEVSGRDFRLDRKREPDGTGENTHGRTSQAARAGVSRTATINRVPEEGSHTRALVSQACE